jgi:hypothetical protein
MEQQSRLVLVYRCLTKWYLLTQCPYPKEGPQFHQANPKLVPTLAESSQVVVLHRFPVQMTQALRPVQNRCRPLHR